VKATAPAVRLNVSLRDQTLVFRDLTGHTAVYSVSTALKGPGCESGSCCTPVGLHRVRLKIGQDCPVGAVFVSRRPTGEIFSEELRRRDPDRDWILSRILWLEGLVPGLNRGGHLDTLRRYIYIHGAADEDSIGIPASHGCIRMKNADIVALFARVPSGASVNIEP
jgi:L,D-transpeptidase YbiS